MTLSDLVSRKLKETRLAVGLTQSMLAERTGFEERFISQLENNPRNMTLKTLERLAKGLGVTVSSLVSEEKDDPTNSFGPLPRKMKPGFDEALKLLRIHSRRIRE